jgi:hypothetical protein
MSASAAAMRAAETKMDFIIVILIIKEEAVSVLLAKLKVVVMIMKER